MTIVEAKMNINQPFKLVGFSGLLGSFDKIREVLPDGTIRGDFLEAHCNHCRLKKDQPIQLTKSNITHEH
jgi:hypothetical protein